MAGAPPSSTMASQGARQAMTVTNVDVAVLGGGPSGFGAAIGAVQAGASVALIERHAVLGGMGTAGLVNNFCPAHKDGKRMIIGGVFARLRQRLIERRAIYASCHLEAYDPEVCHGQMHDMCTESGIELRLRARIESADIGDAEAEIRLAGGNSLRASRVVDATGDAVFAHRCGVPTMHGRAKDGAVMPLTFCYEIGGIDLGELKRAWPREVLHDEALNEDFPYVTWGGCSDALVKLARERGELTIPRDHISGILGMPGHPGHATVNFGRVFIADPTDAVQLEQASVVGRKQIEEGLAFFRRYIPGFAHIVLVRTALQIGVRESRHIVGRHVLSKREALACAQFPDVIAQCCYSIDIHSPDSDATVMHGFEAGTHYDIPWRCLIPVSGPSSMVVAGRAISATHEAASSFRVSPSVMAIGEAAGVTAGLSARMRCGVAEVGAVPVQEVLRRHGAILE